MILSDEFIIKYRDEHRVVIEPFNLADVNTASYDVRLGPWYYREQYRPEYYREQHPDYDLFCNIYSPDAANCMWGEKQYAEHAADWMKHYPDYDYRGISPNDRLILIKPQENLLCHTMEFIGGKRNVTTSMKARSSIGRSLLNVCACAGQGDVGYYNRWTMELYNRSKTRTIVLVVGRRIAQIIFDETTPTPRSYHREGNYQIDHDIKALISMWRPQDMLPKLYNDRDI